VVEGVAVPLPRAPVRTTTAKSAAPVPMDEIGPTDLPLAGVRVLDLGVLTAGAGTSSLLADLGAEVIKVESAERPDMFRFWSGSEDSPLFHFSNRSKLGIDLNLKEPTGRETFLDLVAQADVVVENFRRGVLERLGLGFGQLCAANPRIVLGSVSGQGSAGPRSGHTTFGSTLEAASGFSAMTAGADGVPVVSGPNLNLPDQIVCLFAAAALTAAVVQSRAVGRAAHLDISQRDVAVYACAPIIEQSARGAAPRTWLVESDADDGWAAVGADGSTRATALDGQGVLDACLEAGTSAIVRASDGTLVKGFPFTFEHRAMTIRGAAPGIGEHNERILESMTRQE